MNVKINDLMVEQVVTAQLHQTVKHVRGMMKRNKVQAIPVVDGDEQPVGIVSATDMLGEPSDGAPISQLMTRKVYSVPQYDDVHVAARIMRNHKIHHVLVTHEQKLVGILSSFDLLKLVEDHRFVMKNAPTPSKRHGSRRA